MDNHKKKKLKISLPIILTFLFCLCFLIYFMCRNKKLNLQNYTPIGTNDCIREFNNLSCWEKIKSYF